MSRRDGREVVLKTLFELDLNPTLDFDIAFATAKDEHENLTKKDENFALVILRGVKENIEAIDELIGTASSSWKVERMAAVDRAVLRLASYELKFSEEKLSSSVVINEAVELAKNYGADESSRFVNGVLSGILKKLEKREE